MYLFTKENIINLYTQFIQYYCYHNDLTLYYSWGSQWHNWNWYKVSMLCFRLGHVFHGWAGGVYVKEGAGGGASVCSASTLPRWSRQLTLCFDSHFCIGIISCLCSSAEDLSFRWMLNEFPEFIPLDKRRFVSQSTGNLYISTVRAPDSGNYSCFVSSPSIAKSVFSKFIPLVPIAERESVYHHQSSHKQHRYIWIETTR